MHSTFEPDVEYVNGEIEQRNVGEYDHNAVQKAILLWFWPTRQRMAYALNTGKTDEVEVRERSSTRELYESSF